MVRIGIISLFNKENILRCLKKVLPSCIVLSAVPDNDVFYALEKAHTSFCIIDLCAKSCFVDVLILDSNDKVLISSALRSISPDTHLLYNSDCCPEIIHPFAAGYGFSHNSSSTVSSIRGHEAMLCLRPIVRLDNSVSEEVEFRVNTHGFGINGILCAAACGMVCGTVDGGIEF